MVKNIMKKIARMFENRRWFYIISEIVAVYATYLLSRLWFLEPIGIISIGLVLSFLLLWLTRKYLKHNAKYTIKKRKTVIILIFEVGIISLLLLAVGMNFFVKDYTSSIVKIKSTSGQKIDYSVIDGVVINNLVYLRYDDKFNNEYDEYRKINNGIVQASLDEGGTLSLELKRCYSAKVVFNFNRSDLEIDDGSRITKLYASGQSSTYVIRANSVFDNHCVIRGIGSFMMIFYLIYLLLMFVMNSENRKKRYFIFTALAVLSIGLFYINDCSLLISPDSYTYVDFDFKSLLELKPGGRTPVYPLVINGIRLLFSNNFLEFTVIFQYAMWFVSILFLYKVISMLTKNEKLSTFFSILYAISPFAVIWNGSILTESLALSGTIIFIYYIIKYIKTDKALYGNISIVLSLVLTFLRPTAIIYLVGLLIFIIMKLIFEKFKMCDLKCLITEVLCLVFVVFYAICFHKVFGIYSISDAVVRQDLMVTIREGFYKNSNDEEFIENVERALANNPDNEWNAMAEVLVKYPLAKTKELTNYCRNKDLKAYAKYLIRLVKDYAEIKFEGYAFLNMNPYTLWIHNALHKSFVIITFLHAYLLIAIEIVSMVVKWIKGKKVPWIYCGLFFFPLVIIVSSFIGTCGEFMRTACCCVPFVYLIFIMLMYDVFLKKGVKRNGRIN